MKILFIIDSLQRHYFFIRIAKAIKNKHEVYFATTEPLSKIITTIKGYKSFHLKKLKPKHKNQPTPATLNTHKENLMAAESAIEYLNGMFNIEETKQYIESIHNKINEIIKKEGIERVVIWNGQQIAGRATSLVTKKTKTETRFLEISNLTDSIFCDHQGVNALSSIANNISIIDNLEPISAKEHQLWITAYEKAKDNPLPQAQTKIKHKSMSAINHLLKLSLQSCCTSSLFSKKIKNKSQIKMQSASNNAKLPENYIFLPLQVSTDTQIKLHSDVDNIEAIKIAHEEARKIDCELVIKFHPAETNAEEIEKVLKMKEKINFLITNENTIKLLKKSKMVITINSTTGIEALIYGKEIKVLGRALYNEFNQQRLQKYIHRFLIPGVDYFGDKEIPEQSALRIIE